MDPLKLIEDARRLEEDIAAHDAQCLSERALRESTGPLPVVGSGGVVVGRCPSAGLWALRDTWLASAKAAALDVEYFRGRHEYTTAEKYEWKRDIYLTCAEELGRQIVATSERQPTPNGASET